MQENGLDYKPISSDERERLKDKLFAAYVSSFEGWKLVAELKRKFVKLAYYKVPFTEVLSLVSSAETCIWKVDMLTCRGQT